MSFESSGLVEFKNIDFEVFRLHLVAPRSEKGQNLISA